MKVVRFDIDGHIADFFCESGETRNVFWRDVKFEFDGEPLAEAHNRCPKHMRWPKERYTYQESITNVLSSALCKLEAEALQQFKAEHGYQRMNDYRRSEYRTKRRWHTASDLERTLKALEAKIGVRCHSMYAGDEIIADWYKAVNDEKFQMIEEPIVWDFGDEVDLETAKARIAAHAEEAYRGVGYVDDDRSYMKSYPKIETTAALHVVGIDRRAYDRYGYERAAYPSDYDYCVEVEISNDLERRNRVKAKWRDLEKGCPAKVDVWDFEEDGEKFDLETAKARIARYAEKRYRDIEYVEVDGVRGRK